MDEDILTGGLGGAAQGFAAGGPVGAGIGAGLGIISGLFSGGNKRKEAEARARREAIINGIVVPTPEELKYLLEEYRSVGEYQPVLEGLAEQLGPSAYEDIQIDPRLREAQMTALDRMAEVGASGLTEGDLAELRMVGRDVDAASQAEQQRLLQEMAMRGQATGGQELAARLQASQSSANRRADEYDRRVMAAQARALDAMSQSGTMAGNIRTQDYGEASDKARARDAISQFNLGQRVDTRRADLGRLNDAQLLNLQNRQRIADANVGVQHQQGAINQNALLESNRLDTAKRLAQAGIHGEAAQMYGQRAQNQLQNTHNMLTSAAQFAKGLQKDKDKGEG